MTGSQPGWDDVVCVASSQVSSPVGDEVAILGLDKGVYYGLNESGARIWSWLQEPVKVSELHARLIGEYEVEPETARNDLLEVLGQLVDAGLVEVRRGEAA